MKRLDFYKTYCRVTDRAFSDRVIRSAGDREQAWRRGQTQVSKPERRVCLAGQYLALGGAVWFLAAGEWAVAEVLLALYLLTVWLTDFSLIKMELLYRIYRRENLFSELLYQNFLGKTDGLWCAVKPLVQSRVSGFARIGWGKLWVRYRVCFRKKREDVTIVIRPGGIWVQSGADRLRLADAGMTLGDAAQRIAEELNM